MNNSEQGFEITESKNKPMTLELCLISNVDNDVNLNISVDCTEEFKELGWKLVESKNPELIEKVLESLKNNIKIKMNVQDKTVIKSLNLGNE